jgi:hypothetical protein
MANIKKIEIVGEIPFNAAEHHDMCKFLGQLNTPTIGIHIKYTSPAASRPNKFGGRTAYYKFCISGSEAVSHGWIDKLMIALVNCGSDIHSASARDIEDKTILVIHVPEKSKIQEFVCELRFSVQDSTQDFECHNLETWLKSALVVDLNMEEAGMFQTDANEEFESACVGVAAELKTLCHA